MIYKKINVKDEFMMLKVTGIEINLCPTFDVSHIKNKSLISKFMKFKIPPGIFFHGGKRSGT